jgi:hypothetical protein
MKTSKRIHAAFAAAFVVLAAAPAFSITGTQWVKDFEHPYVGLVVFYDSSGEFVWRCSGSLISPTKFLTAGHCTDSTLDGVAGEGAYTARVYFQQNAGANYNPETEIDPVSGYPEECAAGTYGVTCMTASSPSQLHNYGFSDFAGFPNTRDVGLVILDAPMYLPAGCTGDACEFGELPDAGILDALATARGQNKAVFTVSGYGLTYRPADNSVVPAISFRERLMAASTLVNLNSAMNDGFNLQTQGNGNGRGGTCSGDSGGPVFLGSFSSNLIVAVTSFGLNALCRGTDFGYRIDRPEVLAWIENTN